MTVGVRPQRNSFFLQFYKVKSDIKKLYVTFSLQPTVLNTLSLAVVQKRSESTRVQMIEYGYEKIIVKFKCIRELLRYLPHAVDELEENGGPIGVRMVIITVANSLKNVKKLICRLGVNLCE